MAAYVQQSSLYTPSGGPCSEPFHKNQGSCVIPEHAEELRALYKYFLPDWMDIALKNCTQDEAIRRKLFCIKMLQLRGITELVEEVSSFGVPVLVPRETTERPEGVAAGVAKLVGSDTRRIHEAATAILDGGLMARSCS